MAITGAIFNSLIYGDTDSADYGIYITGEAVYNAPERAVELVSVPGRNGSIAIDQGHWENIEIEYPAGCFGDDQTDFATALSDFRNAICSQLGYQRLSDTYHPDEYRMALYTAGLEVSPTRKANGTGGEFSIKFNAKPQRWLTGGETAVTVTSGDTLTNPTPYDARPLLAVKGYGTIGFNGFAIDIENAVMGELVLSPTTTYQDYSNSIINSGDSISVAPSTITPSVRIKNTSYTITNVSVSLNTSETSDFEIDGYTVSEQSSLGSRTITIQLPTFDFTAGTTTNKYAYYYASVTWMNTSGTTTTERFAFTIRVRNSAGRYDSQIAASIYEVNPTSTTNLQFSKGGGKLGNVTIDSTKSILGDPTLIDCELGEAYMVDDDELVGLNQYIDLGSDLPTLAPGENEITFDNTITELKVTPNWWRL